MHDQIRDTKPNTSKLSRRRLKKKVAVNRSLNDTSSGSGSIWGHSEVVKKRRKRGSVEGAFSV